MYAVWGVRAWGQVRDFGEDTSGILGGQVRDWGDRIVALSHWMLSSHVCYNPCHFLTLDRFVITADLCYVSKKHINGKIPPNLNNMITLVLSLYSDCTKISVSFESCLEEDIRQMFVRRRGGGSGKLPSPPGNVNPWGNRASAVVKCDLLLAVKRQVFLESMKHYTWCQLISHY